MATCSVQIHHHGKCEGFAKGTQGSVHLRVRSFKPSSNSNVWAFECFYFTKMQQQKCAEVSRVSCRRHQTCLTTQAHPIETLPTSSLSLLTGPEKPRYQETPVPAYKVIASLPFLSRSIAMEVFGYAIVPFDCQWKLSWQIKVSCYKVWYM